MKSKRFYKDILGRWFKRYETSAVMVTDEWLIDTLDIKEETENLLTKSNEEYLDRFVEYYSQQVIPEAVMDDIDFIPENVEYSCGVADQAFVDHIVELVEKFKQQEGKE